jgi:hypothetical protein
MLQWANRDGIDVPNRQPSPTSQIVGPDLGR